MQHNWQAVWDRVVDPAVPLDELTDSELEEVAAIGETRPERLEWAAAVRADDVYAARRARRRAVDPRFAARVERDVAVRRAVRETAGGRMRIPTESEWTERHPDLPRRLYAAQVAFARRVNAAADRRRPELVRRALRRAPVAARRPACGCSPRPRPRARIGRRPRGSRRSTRSSDDDPGDGASDGAGHGRARDRQPRNGRADGWS